VDAPEGETVKESPAQILPLFTVITGRAFTETAAVTVEEQALVPVPIIA
jgi:hypothetical protein